MSAAMDPVERAPWLATRYALVFIAAVLAGMLVLPLFVRERLEAVRLEMSQVAEPARQASEEIARTLAVEVAADREFQLTGRASFRARFLAASAQQQQAFAVLTRLGPALGPQVVRTTAALSAAVQVWGRLPVQTFNGVVTPAQRLALIDTEDQLFGRAIAAAVALDDSIHRTTQRQRGKAERVAVAGAVATAGLSALALVALLLVTWLARQLRRLAQEQAQLRNELRELFSARDRLIRGLSHDVKNPLGAADGFASLLESGVIPEAARQQDALRRIRASIQRALRLLEDVLDLARAEAGRLEVRSAPVDVRELAAEILEEYRAQAERAGMCPTFDVADELPPIHSDAARISQIIGNLVSNAIKYARGGGMLAVRVGVHAGPGASATEWLSVEVRDRGPGIPADALERIFDEFTRLQPDGNEGAGLGLAISRRVARALGGDLTVESTPGEGTTFILRLPNATVLAA